MKRLIIILLLPFFCLGQKHASLFKTTTDKFTGEQTIGLISPIIITRGPKKGILVDLTRSGRISEVLTLIIEDNEFGCTISGTDHIVYFLFMDGTRYSAYNSAKGCEGHVFILLTEGPMINKYLSDQLMIKDIASIRIASDKGNYDFDLTKLQAAKMKASAREFFGGGYDTSDQADTAKPVKRAKVAAPVRVPIN